MDAERLDALPTTAGVYLFKGDRGRVLYVGKAQNLRARVRSYFHAAGDGRVHVPLLVERTRGVDVVMTPSVKDALLLENELIKRHRPTFNVRLRDDKQYLALRLDPREAWPRPTQVRRFRSDGALYFGPYTSSAAMRESLSFLLKSAKVPVEAHESADAFLSKLPQASTGCVITDVRMPGMSGIDLLKRLRELNVAMPVIVVTGHGDVPLAVEAMKYGASDFLEKPFEDDVLLAAVRSALSQQASDQERQVMRAAITQRLSLLSGRERQVLDGLVAGRPNKTIAYDLGISPRTIEIYRANVMTKMEAASLSDLVRMALTADLLEKGPKAS